MRGVYACVRTRGFRRRRGAAAAASTGNRSGRGLGGAKGKSEAAAAEEKVEEEKVEEEEEEGWGGVGWGGPLRDPQWRPSPPRRHTRGPQRTLSCRRIPRAGGGLQASTLALPGWGARSAPQPIVFGPAQLGGGGMPAAPR